jgi:hypothetical protein
LDRSGVLEASTINETDGEAIRKGQPGAHSSHVKRKGEKKKTAKGRKEGQSRTNLFYCGVLYIRATERKLAGRVDRLKRYEELGKSAWRFLRSRLRKCRPPKKDLPIRSPFFPCRIRREALECRRRFGRVLCEGELKPGVLA